MSEDKQSTAPNEHRSHAAAYGEKRNGTFGLNSREFYEAVREPQERPWIPNGALPRAPRTRGSELVFVEHTKKGIEPDWPQL